jgi:hypothetical protein
VIDTGGGDVDATANVAGGYITLGANSRCTHQQQLAAVLHRR